MLIAHDGKAPKIDPSARIAPTAVICADVTIGADTSIGFGAVLTAETGPVTIGSKCVIIINHKSLIFHPPNELTLDHASVTI